MKCVNFRIFKVRSGNHLHMLCARKNDEKKSHVFIFDLVEKAISKMKVNVLADIESFSFPTLFFSQLHKNFENFK